LGTLNGIKNLLNWGKSPLRQYSRYISADAPLFTAYGRDIMASDIVKTAIHRIAEAVSKCVLRSIVEKTNPRRIETAGDEINALFAARVNPLATLKDYLYKAAYLTVRDRNCFIYPAFTEIPIAGTAAVKRFYTGFYPLEGITQAAIYHNGAEARIELSNATATFDMPYSDIIHLRHAYGANPFLGGDGGEPFDKRGLLKNLQVIDTIKECVPKTLEASLSIKGILTMKGMPAADKQELKREEFENRILNSKYGIIATDYESEFHSIDIKPNDLPQNILGFIQQEILYPFGVSLPVMAGKFNDDEYAAFYQTAVEGLLLSIAQAHTAAVFTPRQLSYGHKIKAYDRLTQNLSIEKRIHIVEMAKESGIIEADEQRELLGYEPNGEPTRVSLNYIDKNIVNSYQLNGARNGGGQPQPSEPTEPDEEDVNNA
jgi:hypothetical protein